MIRTLADVNRAVEQGRLHQQRILKNAGTAYALQWADSTFASGQPGYDARVGTAGTFTPAIAQRNDSVYFPPIDSGMSRHLLKAAMWSNQATFNGPGSVVLFDLLGFYPLIDGDSTDIQPMDNAQTLPRYSTGDGVVAVIVNHVAPATQNGIAIVNYTGVDNVDRNVTVQLSNNGVNLVSTGSDATTGSAVGSYAMQMTGGNGIKKINSVQYTTPPSGLHVIYLIKVLGTMVLGDNLVCAEKEFLTKNGFNAPRIYDGAWLSWFSRIGSGTARTVTWFGQFDFIWG